MYTFIYISNLIMTKYEKISINSFLVSLYIFYSTFFNEPELGHENK